MPRIEPVENPDSEQAKLLSKSLPGPDGQPLNVFKTLVRWPELMRRVNALGGFFFVAASLDPHERELVILRTAAFARGSYEVGQHRWLGAEVGLSPDEIAAAIDQRLEHAWSPEHSAMLALVDELLETDTVGDKTWNAAALYFDETQRTELLALVGYYRMLAGILNGLVVELDGSVEELLARPTN